MSTLKQGLHTFRITFSLDKKPAHSYSKVLLQAKKYIHAKEGASARCEVEEKPSTKKARGDSQLTPTNKSNPPCPCSPRRSRDPIGRPPCNHNYTPLFAPPLKILMEIKSEEYLQRPPLMRSDVPHSRNKYYRFHRDHGHDTNECHHLQ